MVKVDDSSCAEARVILSLVPSARVLSELATANPGSYGKEPENRANEEEADSRNDDVWVIHPMPPEHPLFLPSHRRRNEIPVLIVDQRTDLKLVQWLGVKVDTRAGWCRRRSVTPSPGEVENYHQDTCDGDVGD